MGLAGLALVQFLCNKEDLLPVEVGGNHQAYAPSTRSSSQQEPVLSGATKAAAIMDRGGGKAR